MTEQQVRKHKALSTGIIGATALALVVLPIKYSIGETVELRDVIGGNEALRTIEVEVADAGEPTPLPNPAVFQDEAQPAETMTMEITIPAERETEVKLHMTEGKVAIYSWSVDRGDIYADFHGHDPSFGDSFFVRYKEHQEGSGNNGSLTAPFSGEHGWYWLNYNDFDVTVTLTVTGYYNDVIDYGLF